MPLDVKTWTAGRRWLGFATSAAATGFLSAVRQPGFISTQLHLGMAESTTFVNVAGWGIRACARRGLPIARVPTLLSPGLRRDRCGTPRLKKVAVAGVCVA